MAKPAIGPLVGLTPVAPPRICPRADCLGGRFASGTYRLRAQRTSSRDILPGSTGSSPMSGPFWGSAHSGVLLACEEPDSNLFLSPARLATPYFRKSLRLADSIHHTTFSSMALISNKGLLMTGSTRAFFGSPLAKALRPN